MTDPPTIDLEVIGDGELAPEAIRAIAQILVDAWFEEHPSGPRRASDANQVADRPTAEAKPAKHLGRDGKKLTGRADEAVERGTLDDVVERLGGAA